MSGFCPFLFIFQRTLRSFGSAFLFPILCAAQQFQIPSRMEFLDFLSKWHSLSQSMNFITHYFGKYLCNYNGNLLKRIVKNIIA
jgi:hypothetical protein